MTRDEAEELYDKLWWVGKKDDEIVMFQLFEERLCMPWDLFQEVVEKVLRRPVFTHEFAYPDALRQEYLCL